MISSKSISLALAALVLVVLAGASSAFAQTVTFNLGTAPTFVANTGRSEVLGQVTLTADFTCGAAPADGVDGFCVSTQGTIQILYPGVNIDNGTATGVCVAESIQGGALSACNAAATYVGGGVTVTNTTSGGVVAFAVLGGTDVDAGDQFVVTGVRGQIDLSFANAVGSAILGVMTASPSTIASFQPTQEVVARSADPLTIAFGPWTVLQCRRTIGAGSVTVTEGYNTAFVDHDNDVSEVLTPGTTINDRPLFGGTNNSRVNIVITGKPSGITIAWPAQSGLASTGARLDLIPASVTANGSTATYVFSTPNQAASDVVAEVFVIAFNQATGPLPAVGVILLSLTPNDFGSTTGQGQMFPPATPTGARPRYNHPLENVPGAAWLTVAPCTTNLLFPWVIQVTPGLDTGLAISNTSADPYGTVGQTGTCAINLYPTDLTTNNGVSAGGAITMTTAPLQAGSVWRAAMSGITAFAGRGGYIIAVCNFQYGHGFAYITDNFSIGAANTAQGYLALIIPDPVILGGVAGCGTVNNPAGNYRSAGIGADDRIGGKCIPYGEGLAQ